MVLADPKASRRRLWWERVVWYFDMTVDLLIAFAGIVALWFTSDYVISTVDLEAAVILWGLLLFVGGVVTFLGRFTRLWALELPGNVAAGSGTALYAGILVPAVQEGSSLVLFVMILAAWLSVCRRYAELQILVSEPGLDTFRARVAAALARRTQDVVPRQHY